MKGRLFLLLALFALCFAAPIFGARLFLGEPNIPVITGETDLFPFALPFNRKDSRIVIPNAEPLNIQKSDKVLFLSWFKIRKLPREGEKLFLFSKLDNDSKNLNGYVVALTRKGEAIRPTVYWKNENGKGGWYLFSELQLMLGEWFMLGISFYDDQILGAYYSVYRSAELGKATLAGGVDLEEPIFPSSQSKFIIGSVDAAPFKGKVGPFCLFNLEENSVSNILKEILKAPAQLPQSIKRDRLRFCSYDWKSDLSPFNHPISFVVGTGSESDE